MKLFEIIKNETDVPLVKGAPILLGYKLNYSVEIVDETLNLILDEKMNYPVIRAIRQVIASLRDSNYKSDVLSIMVIADTEHFELIANIIESLNHRKSKVTLLMDIAPMIIKKDLI